LIVAVVVPGVIALAIERTPDFVDGVPPSSEEALPPPHPASDGTATASNNVATRLITDGVSITELNSKSKRALLVSDVSFESGHTSE
jgi:hypothetical protein